MLRTTILSMIGVTAICAAATLTAQSSQVNKHDDAFLRLAAEADMMTAHLGQTAEDRAAKSQVKDFGKKLSADHTADYQQLCEIGSKTGEAIPKGIDARDNREITALDRAKGKAFDHQFLAHEVAEHQRLVRAFKEEAEHGTNPDIKAYATKALPAIEGHLHQAEDLLKAKA